MMSNLSKIKAWRILCRCGIARMWHEGGAQERCPKNAGRMDWIDGSSFKPTDQVATEEEADKQHWMKGEDD